MKAIKLILLLVSGLILFTACPYPRYFFTVCNNSDRDVWIISQSSIVPHPDTAIYRDAEDIAFFSKGICQNIGYNRLKGEDTLHYFIFDADTINAYSWNEIKEGYKILRRYDLSGNDIELLKESITYPPSPKMRDMKMYPPYSSEGE